MRILLYSGHGVGRTGLNHLSLEIQGIMGCEVLFCNSTNLQEKLDETISLFVVPGGRDLPYHRDLDGKGTDWIRAYIEQGGGYLGICAGAYFACAEIEFEKNGDLEICESRSLQLFSGIAKGSVYGLNEYSYTSNRGARAAYISSCFGPGYIYFNGGCTFVGDLKGIEVLSSYLDLPDTPSSIILGSRGKGKFCLSGVHLETSFRLLDKEALALPMLCHLEEKEEVRKALFSHIVHRVARIESSCSLERIKKNNDNTY